MQTKKIINNGDDAVDEMLEGILLAHADTLTRPEGAPRGGDLSAWTARRQGGVDHWRRFRARADLPRFRGRGDLRMPPPSATCSRLRHRTRFSPAPGKSKAVRGVLYMYGNYAGDVMNFDMAAEMAAMEDIEVRTVLTTDDVASAPREQADTRRGVAGNFFIFKAAGAACDLGLTLDECEAIACRANARTFTMGVALSPCSLPQTRRWNFDLGADEMEIGMGIHGEPGIARGPLRPADELVDDMMDRILGEMGAAAGDSVTVLVNSLGRHAAHGTLHHESPGPGAAWGCRPQHTCNLGRQLVHVPGNGRSVRDRHAPG